LVPPKPESERDEGTFFVLLALGANLGVVLLKLVAGLISGSGALLSEAAHSANPLASTRTSASTCSIPVTRR
jgi:divalent metal cation (Fe/Co/Zn/Cd) transporter